MRRSAAPSQINNGGKRPRFVPPIASSLCNKVLNTNNSPNVSSFEKIAVCGNESSRTQQITLEKVTSHNPKHLDIFKTKSSEKHLPFKSPLKDVEINEKEENLENTEARTCYYSVLWCKNTNKKHKTWEGDAVLIVKGRTTILKDMEGKDIGRSSSGKSKELELLEEGHTLVIGGKLIEVTGIVTEESYLKGRCFEGFQALQSGDGSSGLPKSFVNPEKTENNMEKLYLKPVLIPRHDPAAPNALVMPRPLQKNQLLYNKGDLPILDIVVDPYLAVHLRQHQRDGILFLYECILGFRQFGGFGAILADEMGLGKTLQCIALIWTLYKQGPFGGKPFLKKILIVTPSSLVLNWMKEFKKWLSDTRILIFAVGQNNKPEEFIKSPIYPIMIISYEMFLRYHELVSKLKFDLVICDEGHRLKNSSIKTTSLLQNLPCKRRILLTGTPIQNDLQEFFAIVEFCNPGVLGSRLSFKSVFEDPIVHSRQPECTEEAKQLGNFRALELSRVTGLFVLRRTQEVIKDYLPLKVENVVFCKPSSLQICLFKKLLSTHLFQSCFNSYNDGSIHLLCISALKKLCNEPSLIYKLAKQEKCGSNYQEFCNLLSSFPSSYDAEDFSCHHSGKLSVLTKLLNSLILSKPIERIVLVSNYTKTLDILQKLCSSLGLKFVRLDGSTPTLVRQQIVDNFNDTYCQEQVFLLSSKAGGVGLNLTGASRILLFDIDWNPATDIQAMSRVWRDGQTKPVHIYRLLTMGTIEEKIYQRQISKQGLSGAVMDLKDYQKVKFSLEDLKDLFTLHEDTLSVTHDMLSCDCTGQSNENKFKLKAQDSSLMDWQHLAGPVDSESLNDKHLLQAKEHITFIFRNVTNQVVN